MSTLSRRSFTQQSLGTLLTYSLLETISHRDAFADEVKPIAAKWLVDVNQLSVDMKGQKLPELDWQKKVEDLFAKVELNDVLKLIDFDKLMAGTKYIDNGALSLRFNFPQVEGVPKQLVFGKQIFALKKDRSVVPHGHNNMATAFLILKGDLQGKHYDRMEDQKEHIVIKPTIDRKFSPGECSTVSDYKDNVHWFKAITEPAFIFNLHVMGIRPGASEPTGRIYLDPQGEQLAGGLIKARRIGYEESLKLYG
jgi:hypothetical protein